MLPQYFYYANDLNSLGVNRIAYNIRVYGPLYSKINVIIYFKFTEHIFFDECLKGSLDFQND